MPRSSTFWWTVVMLALPIALQMLLQSLLGMADVVMVSGLGSEAVAAVGLAAKLHFLLLVLMSGLGTGCSVLVAQYSGANKFSSCQRTLAVTLVVGVVTIVPFVLLFGVAPQVWLGWINPDPQVVELAAQYLRITAPALLLIQVSVIFEASLRALGNTTLPLVAGAVSVLINIALNYVLIFGHFGFPALGVAGAAWATLVARTLQMLFIVGWVYGRNHGFALRWHHFKEALVWKTISRFVAFTLPLMINYGIWGLGNATYHVLTGYAGTHALAVMGVIVPIESAFFALFVGLANASAVMVGRSLGADKKDEAWRLYKIFDRLTLILVLLLALLLWSIRPWILSFFGQVEEPAASLLNHTLIIFCVLVWIKVLNMVRIIGVLRAGGDNRFVLTMDFTVMWVIGLPVVALAIFWLEWPFLVIYALMFLEDAFKFFPAWWRIGKRLWMKNLTRDG
ncbi:MATE family efflux transporter [Marinimicrobium sp. ABcell2]|nr:MATE family efflux transporter [Marinimicrobium sp. ABcell2]MDQ2076834.1 MATE family efflux transporter [Marinimicrobium sp. ABcell2]